MPDVLHISLNIESFDFLIWAETPKLRKLKPLSDNVQRHPFTSSNPLEALSYKGNLQRKTQAVVYLPSDHLPYPSPELAAQAKIRSSSPPAQVQIKPWRITALSGNLADIYNLLLLPSDTLEAAGLLLGRSWLWYSQLVRWVQNILKQGLFLPHIYLDPTNALVSKWRVTAEEEERLADFSRRAPWSVLAASSPLLVGMLPLETHITRLVSYLLGHLIYQQIMQQDNYYYSYYHPILAGIRDHFTRQWSWALCFEGGLIGRLNSSDMNYILRLYENWQNEYKKLQTERYRLQARLMEADDENPWHLALLLQDRHDPKLLISVQDLNDETLLNKEMANQARATLDKILERLAGREALLSRAKAPSYTVPLSHDEVLDFLRSGASSLEARGVTVLLPDWAKLDSMQVRAKARIFSDNSESSGLLGLNNLLRIETQVMLGDQVVDRESYEKLVALKQSLLRVNGRWIMIDPEQLERGLRYFEQNRPLSMAEGLRLSLAEKGKIGEVFVDSVTAEGWFSAVLKRLRQTETLQEVPPPEDLETQMRPYQERGLSWLNFLHQYHLGACLADDMGLGKTVQAIAFLLHLRKQGQLRSPALVIAPTSVVMNWRRELARFAPTLRVYIHQGKERLRQEAFLEAAQQAEVVVSSYALLPRDREMLAKVTWSVLILDEAHNIKNSSTKQAQAARSLVANYRMAMTGTPVENRLAELWSIFNFLNSGYLGSDKAFQAQFARPIERNRDEDAIQELRRLTSPFILRRMKTDPNIIQDLPDKIESRVYANLTVEQASLYEAVVRDTMAAIERAESPMARRGLILRLLMQLKQVCNHPAHFLKDGSELKGRSGKLERLCDMLEEIEDTNEGDKVLIFTQFAEMGELLRQHLAAVFKTEPLWLQGADTPRKREATIQRFRSDPQARLFILSLKAGGVGLNLTEANHVFHYDRWWNPAVEDQATDRAFRIGQKQTVQVHKFVCSGTLEERIDDLIESKKGLAQQVVGSDESWLTELSSTELRDLVRLRLLGD